MIIPHFDLQPQFKHMNYFIYSIIHIINDNAVDMFFFQSSKRETGLKTPAKQNGMKH